jgi:RNA polymerase sigma-70 factor (ECF subfamily)
VFKSQQKNDSIDNYVNYTSTLKADDWDVNQIGLRKEVHKLKDDFKKVIELSYFNGYTQKEIAEILAIPEGTVKTRMRNALIELRKQFV